MLSAVSTAPWRGWMYLSNLFTKSKTEDVRKITCADDLTDHIARDIGIRNTELARLRHEWPSQTFRHPRM